MRLLVFSVSFFILLSPYPSGAYVNAVSPWVSLVVDMRQWWNASSELEFRRVEWWTGYAQPSDSSGPPLAVLEKFEREIFDIRSGWSKPSFGPNFNYPSSDHIRCRPLSKTIFLELLKIEFHLESKMMSSLEMLLSNRWPENSGDLWQIFTVDFGNRFYMHQSILFFNCTTGDVMWLFSEASY